MRIGTHPLKQDIRELTHDSFHRIIVPVYIPHFDGYYKNLLDILRVSIQSIRDTINRKLTRVTIINNGSHPQVFDYLNAIFTDNMVDKVVHLEENRGKVEAVLNEARASVEEFVTIADADIFFFSGWEKAIFELFKTFPKAAVVSPMPAPQHAFYFNKSCRFDLLVSSRLKWGNVSPLGVTLIERGFSNFGKLEFYKGGQYYTEANGLIALLGCGHFCATYKRDIFFFDVKRKVELVFKGGYEADYIDYISEQSGNWRLATQHPYAYHLGNTLPDDEILKLRDEYAGKYANALPDVYEKPDPSMQNLPVVFFKLKRKLNHLLRLPK